MKKKIITISREFGSGGRFIGESLAKTLGYKYYDKDLIAKIAEKSGLSPEYINRKNELSPRKGFFSYAFIGRNAAGISMEDKINAVQREIILDIAGKENCVIIGRNADYILKDRDDVLNVYISAKTEDKIKRIMDLYKVEEKEASKLIHDIDKRRGANYNYYTDEIWGKASNYDLCLNRSTLGYELCQELIMKSL